jgi:hypothetical protein
VIRKALRDFWNCSTMVFRHGASSIGAVSGSWRADTRCDPSYFSA